MNKKKYINIIIVGILTLLYTLSIANSQTSAINFLITFTIVYFILYFLWNKLDDIKIRNKSKDNPILKREFIFYAILIIIFMVIAILAYYPGYYTLDTNKQWKQVQTGEYKNWHPVMETLFMLKIPSLFYNNLISATIFQCIIIFLILIYFCYFCRKNFLNFKQTLIVLLLIVMNPIFIKYSVTLWKDVIYSWCIFLGTLCLIDISMTNGEWIKKINNKVLFIISSLGILFFRHNGIAPFILMYIALIIFYNKKTKFFAISFIVILISNFIITGPVYKAFNIDRTTGGKPEMMGVIMGQISYYYKNQAYFTEEELEILDKSVPLEIIDQHYSAGNFNNIKWNTPKYNKNVNENFEGLMKLYINKSIHNPKMFVRSFMNMSKPIWGTSRTLTEVDYDYKEDAENNNAIKNVSNAVYKELVNYNNSINNTFFRWLFINIGQGLFLIIFGVFMVIKKRSKIKKMFTFYFGII